MNKASIKNFAVWARQKLMGDVTYKMNMLGITEKGISMPLPQSTKDLQFFDVGTKNYAEVHGGDIQKRDALIARLKAKEKDTNSFKTAMGYIVEEVAYTWFNRLIAIRFMEVNNYLPSGIRVLSSENRAKDEPDLVTNPFDSDLDFTPSESDYIINLKQENKSDELFRMLFIKQCNKLNDILPDLFEKTDDYTELLLTISFTDKDGVVYRLIHDIAEDDFNVEKEGQVEIIGWLYQYYNIEPKAAVFARASGEKIKKEEIPAATQLFTPDWIVRYMVENSLGRFWVEGHPDFDESKWKYYVEDAKQEDEVQAQLEIINADRKNVKPEDIKFIDPCMGSGHILVYAFDVLMQIYESYGYTQRDAARSIIKYNLYGLDIDKRAYQLAYFAVMMKARHYNRRILTENIKPNLCYIKSSTELTDNVLNRMGDCKGIAERLINDFKDADEYGSILNINYTAEDFTKLETKLNEFAALKDKGDLVVQAEIKTLLDCFDNILPQAKLLAQKYDVVCTNPPYMGGSGMSAKLSTYVKNNYPDSKSDLFSVFIEKDFSLAKVNGYSSMITMHSWMFLSSFEKLRKKIIDNKMIVNMVHLGAHAFEEIGGEVVQTTSFVIRNAPIAGNGVYFRLVDSKNKEQDFIDNLTTVNGGGYRFIINLSRFDLIPGSPIAYWVSENKLNIFSAKNNIGNIGDVKKGLSTGDNDRFFRLWYEVGCDNIFFAASDNIQALFYGKKWYPINKGGEFRKWYGNNDYVVNYYENGKSLLNFSGAIIRNSKYYFEESLTWTDLTSGKISFRYNKGGFVHDVAGPCVFRLKDQFLYVMGYLNSVVVNEILSITSPTLHYNIGSVSEVPIMLSNNNKQQVEKIVEQNISLSKDDWDSFETSWDFKKHPLI